MKVFAVSLFALVCASAQAETSNYVALVNGGTTKAGHETVTRDDDGNTKVEFIFKDNGRGPELKEQFKVGTDGTFTEYRVAGNSTFGAPVDESFTRQGNKASWTSTTDHGEQEIFGTAHICRSAEHPKAYRHYSARWRNAAMANCRSYQADRCRRACWSSPKYRMDRQNKRCVCSR